MNEWLLRVELNGEWEECRFLSRNEALSTFVDLAKDYASLLRRAILFAPNRNFPSLNSRRLLSFASGRPN